MRSVSMASGAMLMGAVLLLCIQTGCMDNGRDRGPGPDPRWDGRGDRGGTMTVPDARPDDRGDIRRDAPPRDDRQGAPRDDRR